MNTITILLGAAALAGAWYWDTRSWRRKPREELVRMLQANDWRYHKAAIQELRRRGEDVLVYVPRIVAMLVSESTIERAAAQMTLKDCFPDLAREVTGFSPSAGVQACRAKAAPLLTRYGLN